MTVIGSAEIVIKAVTTGVNAQIQKALRDAQAGVRAAGKSAGDDYAGEFDKSIEHALPDSVHNSLSGVDLTGHGSNAASSFNRGFGSRVRRDAAAAGDDAGNIFTRGFQKRVDKASSGPGIFEKFFGGDFDSKIKSAAGAVKDLFIKAQFMGAAISLAGTAISAAAGAIGLLGLAAATAAPAVVALPGMLMAVAQAGAVLMIAMKGVGKAISAGLNPAADTGAAAKAAKAAAKAADNAAKQVEAANKRVQTATRGVADAQEKLARAYEDASKRSRDAIQRVEAAEQDLGDAQNDVLRTQLALNDARDAGAESLQQLGFRAEDAALNEERAALRLQDAYDAYQAVQELPADDRKRIEAELAFKESELNYREAKDSAQDLAKEQEKAAAAGVDGTKEVVSAQEDIVKAQNKVTDSVLKLRDAQEARGDVERQNARAIQDAQQGIADAQDSLAEAVKGLADAKDALADIKAEAKSSTATVDKFAAAMKKLSPEAQNFVQAVVDSKDTWAKFRNELGKPIFAALTPAFGAFTELVTGADGLNSGLQKTAEIVGDVITQFTKVVTEGAGLENIKGIIDGNNAILGKFTEHIDGGSSAIEDLTSFMLKLGKAVQPVTEVFAGWIAKTIKSWDSIAQTGGFMESLQGTFDRAGVVVGKFGDIFRNVWETFKTLLKSAQPAIDTVLATLDELTQKMSDMAEKAAGDGTLAAYFDGIAKNLKPMLELIGSITLAFLKMGSSEKLAGTLEILKGVIPPLEKIFAAGTEAGPALATLAVSVANLIGSFAESGAMTKFFDTLTAIADVITKIISSDLGQKILGFLSPIHGVLAALTLVFGLFLKFGPALLRPITMVLSAFAGIKGIINKIKGLGSGGGGPSPIAGASGSGAGRGGDGGNGGDGGPGGDGGSCECDGKKGHGGGPECVECGSGGGRSTTDRTRRTVAGGSRAAGGSGSGGGGESSSRARLEADVDDRRPVPRPSPAARAPAAAAGRAGSAGSGLEDIGAGAETAAKGTSKLGAAFSVLGKGLNFVMGLLPILIPIFKILYEKNEGFRNAIDGLMATFGELASTVMNALMPVFNALMPVIQNLIGVLGGVLGDVIAKIVPIITKLATTFADTLMPVIQNLVPIIGQVFTTFGEVITGLIPVIMPIITQLISVFTDILLPAIMELLPVVGLIFGTIGEVIGQVLPVILGVVTQLVKIFVDTLIPVIKALLPVFTMVITTILKIISTLVPVILPIITKIINMFVEVLVPVIEQLMPVFTTVITTILRLISTLVPVILPIISKLINLFVEVLVPVIESLMPVFTTVISTILKIVSELIPVILPIITQLVELFADILVPVINSLMPVFTTVIDLILSVISELVPVILPIIMQLVKLFISILMPAIQALLPVITTVFGFLMEIIGKLLPFIGPIIAGLVKIFADVLIPAIEKIQPIVQTVFSTIQSVIEGVFKGISSAYDSIIKPVWEAFEKALDWLGKAFDSVAVWINNAWFTVQTGMVTALNWIITAINWLIDGLNWIITKFGMDAIPKVASASLPAPTKSSGGSGSGSPTGGGRPFATGGYVSGPGGPRDDKVDARLSNGEYVLRASTVRKIGRKRLDALNITGDQMALLGGIIAGKMSSQPQQQQRGVFDWVSDTFGSAVDWVGDKASDAVGFVGSLMKEGIGNGLAKLLETFSADYLDKPEAGFFGTLLKGWVNTVTAGLRKWGESKDEEEKKKFDDKQAAAQALGSNGMWGPGIPYTTGKFAVNTEAARQFIASDLGMPLGDLGGLYGGSVPGSDHAMGKAIDAMVKGWNTPAGIAVGDRVAKWFLDNPNEFGTKYVIWRKQYAEPGKGWTGYSHPGGSNPTLDHYDHVHISFLTGPGSFVRGGGVNSSAVAGGDPTNLDGPPPGAPPGAGATRNQNTVDPIIPHGKMNMDRGSMANVGPLPPGGSVERWRGLYAYALQLEGQSQQYLGAMMNQMRTESTGNPLAYNGYDKNAVLGYPSKGLLQTIPQTFRSFARPGYSTNIWDPLSNALASIRYVLKRYGSLANGYRGVAYDTGGMLNHGKLGINLSGKPERILSPSQTQSFDKLVNAITASNTSSSSWSTSDSGTLSNREMSLVTAVANAVAGRQGDTHVRVFIGERELTDIVDTQVGVYDYATARTIQLGRKP